MSREAYAWSGFGVPLRWLLEFDANPAKNALPDAFGDSYLYSHNPVFAGIRDAAIGFGYRFSAQDTPLWREYQSLSLTALQQILNGMTIPYVDTGTAFRRIVDAYPQGVLPLGFIASSLRRNYGFHESAHCVAHAILEGPGTVWGGSGFGNERSVLHAILSESFANTVEVLGSVVRHMPVLDNVFYPLNSYYSFDERREDLLTRASARLGAKTLFKVLFFSHFEANLTVEKPPESTCYRIIEASDCAAADASLANEVIGTGFRLNPSFRDNTTPAYFELLGHGREYKALATSSWLRQSGNQRFARDLVQLLWKTVDTARAGGGAVGIAQA
jgi:hypothetical protein